jgi:hypothetical protein
VARPAAVSVLQQDRYPLELFTRPIKSLLKIRRHDINTMPQSVEIEKGPPVDTMHDANPTQLNASLSTGARKL